MVTSPEAVGSPRTTTTTVCSILSPSNLLLPKTYSGVGRLLIVVIAFAGLLLAGCGTKPSQELNVFVAAALREAFSDLIVAYEEKHQDVDIIGNFAGSQLLRVQIEEGATADVYISANEQHMRQLNENGFVTAPVTTAATNELVLAVPTGNPADINTVDDLSRADSRVVMAGPAVPAGAYAREMLKKYGEYSDRPAAARNILDRTISFETNVRMVAAKLELGEADAGFVYRTDVLAADGRLEIIDVPVEVQVSARYPMATLSISNSPRLAQQFVVFVRSGEAQKILKTYGFGKSPQSDGMPS